MDNVQGAPTIPYGTEPTAFGTPTFRGTPGENSGQAPTMPTSDKSAVQNTAPVVPVAAPAITPFEELAAKKGFDSPDALAKAYQELEAQNKRVEMSLSELVKSREESLPSQVPSSQEVNTPEEALRVVENLIQKRVRPLEDQLALQTLFSTQPDAKDFANDMARIVKTNPAYTWEDAYKLAKFNALETKSKEQGRQEAYQAIQQKQAASVGTPVRSGRQEEKPLLDIIKDRSVPLEEVRRILLEKASFRT